MTNHNTLINSNAMSCLSLTTSFLINGAKVLTNIKATTPCMTTVPLKLLTRIHFNSRISKTNPPWWLKLGTLRQYRRFVSNLLYLCSTLPQFFIVFGDSVIENKFALEKSMECKTLGKIHKTIKFESECENLLQDSS